MGKIRRKFNEGFKQQLVGELEAGAMTLSAAARKYQLSPSLLVKWRRQAQEGTLDARPTAREKALEAELGRYKAKVAELLMETELLKKLRTSLHRRKNGSTSGLIAPSFPPSAKDVA